MQFLYGRELHSGALEYEYTAEDWANAPCLDESTLASLGLNPKASDRAHEVMQLHTRALVVKSGSRSSTGSAQHSTAKSSLPAEALSGEKGSKRATESTAIC